ncbi:MAG: hypothetical protein R6W99_04315, partial [Clostridia bacterium]
LAVARGGAPVDAVHAVARRVGPDGPKILKPLGIKVTRIAHGISMGVDIEFTDEATLIRALRGRTLL